MFLVLLFGISMHNGFYTVVEYSVYDRVATFSILTYAKYTSTDLQVLFYILPRPLSR